MEGEEEGGRVGVPGEGGGEGGTRREECTQRNLYRVSHDTGHPENLAESQALYKHELDTRVNHGGVQNAIWKITPSNLAIYI